MLKATINEPKGETAQNSQMPRKAEIFSHFCRKRLIFNNILIKLPLSERAIIRAFSRDPHKARESYELRRSDLNTLEALRTATEKFDSLLATDTGSGKDISDEIKKLSSELGVLVEKRNGINATYSRLKSYLKNSEKDRYTESLRRFDAEIAASEKWISRLWQILGEIRKAESVRASIGTLKAALAEAKRKNKIEVFED